jgi:hypothetical protein
MQVTQTCGYVQTLVDHAMFDTYIDNMQFVSDAASPTTPHEHTAVDTPNPTREFEIVASSTVSPDAQSKPTPNAAKTSPTRADTQLSESHDSSSKEREPVSREKLASVDYGITSNLSTDGVVEWSRSATGKQTVAFPIDTILVSQHQVCGDEPTPAWQPDDAAQLESHEARFESTAPDEYDDSFHFSVIHEGPREHVDTVSHEQTSHDGVQWARPAPHLTPAWPAAPDALENEPSLELLRDYRYEIAPWVSVDRIRTSRID